MFPNLANTFLMFSVFLVVTSCDANSINLPSNLLEIFRNNSKFFLIEPGLLRDRLKQDGNGQDSWSNLKWRFKLPEFYFNPNSLSLGMFYEDNEEITVFYLENLLSELSFTEYFATKSPVRFDEENSEKIPKLTHFFLKSSKKFPNLKLHITIFHYVKRFLWIGGIPELELSKLSDMNLQFGLSGEQIYDRFALQSIGSIQFPNEIGHFLSQIPTARYMHCSQEKNEWLKENNLTNEKQKFPIESVREGIFLFKLMMKYLMMEFWMVCGTLLGWYRQCNLTPYSDDTDFATWSRYLEVPIETPPDFDDIPMSYHLMFGAYKHQLQLYKRFGLADRNLEYSFLYDNGKLYGKFDLFFLYQNDTHYRLPIHLPKTRRYAYLSYPPYQLCSVELLDYKLLAPCEPEQLIRLEYGPNWMSPIKQWLWFNSSLNTGPLMAFHSDQPNISQMKQFPIN